MQIRAAIRFQARQSQAKPGHLVTAISSKSLSTDFRRDDEETHGQQLDLLEAPNDFLDADCVGELLMIGERADFNHSVRFASCHNVSISSRVASAGRLPRPASPSSTCRKRRRNLAFALRRACSGSTLRKRARFTIVNSRSPISSSRISDDPLALASSSSPISSRTLSKTCAGGLRGDLPRLDKRWRVARNGIEQAIRLLFVFALFGLDLIPPALHVVRRFCVAIRENVRVAANQLVADRIQCVVNVELSIFRCELRLENRLQQQVAQLIGKAAPVARIDGVENLVSLLE